MGRFHLQGSIAERDRELEGLPARRYSAIGVSRYPAYQGQPGQYPSQPGPIVEPSGQGLGLAQQGETPPILSQREAEINGQHPGVAGLGQVREGLDGVLEGGYRLVERGAFGGPGTGLLT